MRVFFVALLRYVSAEDHCTAREANATRILSRITSCSIRPRLVNGRDVTGNPSRTQIHIYGVYKYKGDALYPIVIPSWLVDGWMCCSRHITMA